jgi:hypothetical protein
MFSFFRRVHKAVMKSNYISYDIFIRLSACLSFRLFFPFYVLPSIRFEILGFDGIEFLEIYIGASPENLWTNSESD